MKTVFIADSHIKGLDDPGQKTLCALLDSFDSTHGVDMLVILGDIFEFWTGLGDTVYYHYLPVLASLKKLHERGTRIVYMEGNHDFFMGPFFTDVLKASVYSDRHVLNLDGKRVLVTHGDTVGTNLRYRLWRGFTRSLLTRALIRALSPSLVWRIGTYLASLSRTSGNSSRASRIEGRQREFAKNRIRSGEVDGVVMAHSHLAALVTDIAEGTSGFYANPGSLSESGNYLVSEDGEFRIECYEG